MEQTLQLRRQLTAIVNKVYGQEDRESRKNEERTPLWKPMKVRPSMIPPTLEQQDVLRQIVAAGI
jgi:hypothetical protein